VSPTWTAEMPTSTYKSAPRPRNAPVFFALTLHLWLIWTAVIATIGYEDHDFDGALLWFTNWGVWNSREESLGYRIIERMNAAAGQPRSFEVAPGHRFRGDELPDAVGMLLQPMVFAWDCYYLPTWSYGTGEFFLYVSHHSFVSIVTRTKTFYERVFPQLEKLDLNPKPGSDTRTKRFCRRP
jgi:hypothetical protein